MNGKLVFVVPIICYKKCKKPYEDAKQPLINVRVIEIDPGDEDVMRQRTTGHTSVVT